MPKKVFQLLSYLKFIIRSSNEHGVHSPFVYNFLTKGLYTKRQRHIPLEEHVLTKAISYFNYKSIGFVDADDYIKDKLVANFDHLTFDTLPLDVIYVGVNGTLFKSISKASYHNDTMLMINGIHKNRERKVSWERIKKLPEVSVTMDLFHCGLVFFRKEQAKEHFKIRV
ncbi:MULTISPECIES: hypothetical protein [Maribacter]|uniref:Uncharacterized protein n=1 Tax=Maribacter flavus TaxID=1658664 RepID=A0A5B2TWE7_9FLAO|nr:MULTISPECIES: hypothetical protein [Maribacter]KAA2218095.1 hypothetical protein F0361_00285 [Maribacter flavus]MDC6406568.1 hypothetical protein [Maribacter sp. PR66]MEE1973686.1 hypothetical protein [Maribacter flavus]